MLEICSIYSITGWTLFHKKVVSRPWEILSRLTHTLTHIYTHTLPSSTHLWRRRRIHPHCSSSRVKADQSFRTDVLQLLAHVSSGGSPSEFLWRETCQSRSLWSVTTATGLYLFDVQRIFFFFFSLPDGLANEDWHQGMSIRANLLFGWQLMSSVCGFGFAEQVRNL